MNMHREGPSALDAASPEKALSAYASEWTGNTGYDPGDLDWVYLPSLPCDLFWRRKSDARAWWRDEIREARRYGAADAWEALLEGPVENPVVIGIYGADDFGIWDGNHRIAAAVLTGAGNVPAVVGILRGLSVDDLPERVRGMLATVMEARSAGSPAP